MEIYTQAMSSAKKSKSGFALCSHISKFDFTLFHRAKPVSDTACPASSDMELHCGLRRITLPKERTAVRGGGQVTPSVP